MTLPLIGDVLDPIIPDAAAGHASRAPDRHTSTMPRPRPAGHTALLLLYVGPLIATAVLLWLADLQVLAVALLVIEAVVAAAIWAAIR